MAVQSPLKSVSLYDSFTKKRLLKDLVHRYEQNFYVIFKESAAGMAVVDPQGYIIQINPAFCHWLGYERNELINMHVLDITHPDNRDETKNMVNEIKLGLRHTIDIEKRYVHKSGKVLWGHLTSTCIFDEHKKPMYMVSLVQDITKRKEIEEERFQQFRRVQKQNSTIVKLATNSAVVNGELYQATEEITQMVSEAMDVGRVSIWLLGEDRKHLLCLNLYERARHKHTKGLRLSASEYPQYFQALELGRAIDVYDAQNDSRTEEFAKNYLIPLKITSMLDAAIRVSGKVVGVVCHEHMGEKRLWRPDEVAFAGEVADQVAQLFLNEERRKALEQLRYAHADLERRVLERTYELRNEMSERKKIEEKEKTLRQQLAQAEKLSSIGLLAAGVAHELNNPLTGLISLLRTFKKNRPQEAEDHKDLTEMLLAADHMARIVEDLNSFSRVSKDEHTHIDLNDVIESTLSFSVHQFTYHNISLTKQFDQLLPIIRGNKLQLQQLLLTLLTNARDAMPHGGELVIKTLYCHKRKVVQLIVKDSGVGIKSEDLPKIFDPFFTTKQVGKGIGLGLSVLHGIVKSHHGEVIVDSKIDTGTKFTIEFPIGQGSEFTHVT